jgi:hypothetical protein
MYLRLVRPTKLLSVLLASGLLVFQAVGADDIDKDGIDDTVEDTPTQEKLWMGVGAYYPGLDTKVSLDAVDGLAGAQVDFESGLGMRDVALMPVFRGSYRFNSRHRINFDYFNLKRNGSDTSEVTFRFGDSEFKADLPITSFFDVEALSVSYGYSLYTDSKKDLELSVGLSIQDIGFGLATTGNLEEAREESGITAPLPTIGLSGFYAFSDKWLFNARAGYFALELNWEDNDKDLGGEIVDASIGISHKTFANVGFGLNWTYFDVDVDYRQSNKRAKIDYTYSGPMFNVYMYF